MGCCVLNSFNAIGVQSFLMINKFVCGGYESTVLRSNVGGGA